MRILPSGREAGTDEGDAQFPLPGPGLVVQLFDDLLQLTEVTGPVAQEIVSGIFAQKKAALPGHLLQDGQTLFVIGQMQGVM